MLPTHCPEVLRALLWAGPESQLRDRAASPPRALRSMTCPLAAHRPLPGSQVPQLSGSRCVQLPQNWRCCCRGQLSGGFAQQCLMGSAFRQCTACSWAVVQQYRQGGWPFILQALQVCLSPCSVLCIARSVCDAAALPGGLQESSAMSTRDAMLISRRPSCGLPGKCSASHRFHGCVCVTPAGPACAGGSDRPDRAAQLGSSADDGCFRG